MLLSDLIETLEDLLDRHGDMIVELENGRPVSEADIAYTDIHYPGPPYALPDNVVIK